MPLVGHRGNSRRRPEEISEFIDSYPDRCDKCGGQIKVYEKSFDEHVVEDITDKEEGGLLSAILWLL